MQTNEAGREALMTPILRILELVKWLEWALDLLDMYDQRLATIDGPEMVFTPDHTEAKEQARKLIQEYKAK